MRKLDYFWASNPAWYEWKGNGDRIIKPDAPPEAQESYKHYLKQRERITAKSNKCMD